MNAQFDIIQLIGYNYCMVEETDYRESAESSDTTSTQHPVESLGRVYQTLHNKYPLHETVPDFIILLSAIDPQLDGLAKATLQSSQEFSSWSQRFETESTKKGFPWEAYGEAEEAYRGNVMFASLVAIPYVNQLICDKRIDELTIRNILTIGKSVYPSSIPPRIGFDKEPYFELVGKMLNDAEICVICGEVPLALGVISAIDQSQDSVSHLGLIPESVVSTYMRVIGAALEREDQLLFFQGAYSPSLAAPIAPEVMRNLLTLTSMFVESAPENTYHICANLIQSALRTIDLDDQSPEYVGQIRNGALVELTRFTQDKDILVPEEQEIPDALGILSFLAKNKGIFWQYPELEETVDRLFLATQPEVARGNRNEQVQMLFNNVQYIVPDASKIVIQEAINSQEYELALNEMVHFSGNKSFGIDDEQKQELSNHNHTMKALSQRYSIEGFSTEFKGRVTT